MKFWGSAIKVGVTVLAALAMGYWAFMMLAKGGCGGEEQAALFHAYFRDATGLVEKSEVQVAGLNMGHIVSKELAIAPPRPELVTQKRFAKITFALKPGVVLYSNATVYKNARSLLGGFYLEIDPGTATWTDAQGKRHSGETIRNGDEIRFVAEAATTDTVIRQISDVMPVLRQITEDVRQLTGGPLQSIGRNIDEGIRENREVIKSMLANMDGITSDVRRITQGASGDVRAILDDIRHTTGVIRSIVGRSDKDVEDTAKKVKDGLEKLTAAIDKLDDVMGNVHGISEDVKGITGDVQEGKGTVGRLLKDEALVDKVEGVVEDTGGFIRSLTQLQTIVELRSEYNFEANSIKTYLRVEIQPRPDKYYLVELVQDPRGKRSVTTRILRSDDPSKPQLTREEEVEISDAFRFTFQLAKRISFATFRFGIKENTGGIGLDFHLWDDRIRFETDIFDFSANVWPRMKLMAAWEFFKRLYVVGGMDDAFNERPVDGSAGGRDFFVGAQLRFNDEDLKSLLMFGGSALGAVGSK